MDKALVSRDGVALTRGDAFSFLDLDEDNYVLSVVLYSSSQHISELPDFDDCIVMIEGNA